MELFRKVIKSYLDEKAAGDPAFAERYGNKDKSIDECCKFIVKEVEKIAKGGYAACTDDYVYGLAVHYYDEADAKASGAPACDILITMKDLSDEDRAEARKVALRRLKEQYAVDTARSMAKRQKEKKEKPAKTAKPEPQGGEQLLFDFGKDAR